MGDPRFQTGDAAIDAALAADLAMVAPMSPDQTNTAEAVEPAFVDVVQRILDENSAWVAAPSRDVVNSIAIRAFVAARMAYEDMLTPATEMMRQRDDAREQRDAHFTEIDRAREIIAGQRLENDRLRSRIMELEKALGPSQEQRNAENLVAIREAIIVREIRMRTEQLRFDAANPDFGDRYQREVAAALADQFDEFADSLEAAPPPASLPRG